MKTEFVKIESIKRATHLVDADGKILGRLATGIARLLMGKHKELYSPHADQGNFVIVINAEKIRVTGKKADQKMYKRFSGYPGGLKETPYNKMLELKPEAIIRHAVKGMTPKNIPGHHMMTRLFVYKGSQHPHAAQKPVAITI